MLRTVSCSVGNAFSTRLKLIWPRSGLKTTKMSKKQFWQKVPGVNGLNKVLTNLLTYNAVFANFLQYCGVQISPLSPLIILHLVFLVFSYPESISCIVNNLLELLWVDGECFISHNIA